MQRPQTGGCLVCSKNHKQAMGWRDERGRVLEDESGSEAAGRAQRACKAFPLFRFSRVSTTCQPSCSGLGALLLQSLYAPHFFMLSHLALECLSFLSPA